MSELKRESNVQAVQIDNGEALSDVLAMGYFAMGLVIMPAAWTAANIAFYVCDTEDGTFVPLYDASTGEPIRISSPAVDKAYLLPAELAPVTFFKLWSEDGAGADENQGGDRALTVIFKG